MSTLSKKEVAFNVIINNYSNDFERLLVDLYVGSFYDMRDEDACSKVCSSIFHCSEGIGKVLHLIPP